MSSQHILGVQVRQTSLIDPALAQSTVSMKSAAASDCQMATYGDTLGQGGGQGTRTHNRFPGTTFPVCSWIDVKLWQIGCYDTRSCWGAESGDVELASVRISLHPGQVCDRPTTFGRQFGQVVTLSDLLCSGHSYLAGFDDHSFRLSRLPGPGHPTTSDTN